MKDIIKNPMFSQFKVQALLVAGITNYLQEFMAPFWTAASYFQTMEKKALFSNSPWQDGKDYLQLLQLNLQTANKVVDGKVMSWVYKLKSMGKEFPLSQFFSDIVRMRGLNGKNGTTAAALNHWLIYDRIDLPKGITKLSFDSYTIPVTPDGTLPVALFGKELNFKRLRQMGIKWLLCYAEEDDLVDAPAALAPLDFLDEDTIEVMVFPRGHGSIATSHSNPKSKCALHATFEHNGKWYRGPVRFQLDLDSCLKIQPARVKLAA